MAIPIDFARTVASNLEIPLVGNLVAQIHAKHVLKEVGEAEGNYPAFAPNLEDRLTFFAYELLSAGCSLIEAGERNEGARVAYRAASLLREAHDPPGGREDGFHLLVSSMAFYCVGHYSLAYIGVRNAEDTTPAAGVIASFLRKDIPGLIRRLNAVLLTSLEPEDALEADEAAIGVGLARAVAYVLEFVLEGSEELLAAADQSTEDARTVAQVTARPGWWWIARLLQLIIRDMGQASMWRTLPPYFGPEAQEQLRAYLQLLAFGKPPIIELWESQIAALPTVLDRSASGSVLNLRTSAGKTRIAELCSLQTLLDDPRAKVLYLAPFRSLAMEIEQAFGSSLSRLGFGVSHLYGGSRASAADGALVQTSSVVIATPEKARVMLRAMPEVFSSLKLIIVDEGHLVGASERFVRNELFVDHLRALAAAVGARLILLSAVLPNAEEISSWVAGDVNRVVRSEWKPSTERFGLLRWNGRRVRVEWQGDFPCFNPSFIQQVPLGFGRRRNPYPYDKNEAIAASAIRLSAVGPVMIFTGKAVSVPSLARAVLLGLGESPPDHPWPTDAWNAFAAVADDDLPADAIEARAARAGVICHSSRLTTEVRLAVERLMRSTPPKVIIATTTLGQGVNIGISSVIVASAYMGAKTTVSRRDFWNICGRAGRAFVDGEGKVLYVIDDTKAGWQRERELELAKTYFEGPKADRIESGLLLVLRFLIQIAERAAVSFELLLEICANNDFGRIGLEADRLRALCDLLDDELLAIHLDTTVNPNSASDVDWVERVFRNSLAAIQARTTGTQVSEEQVLHLLKARASAAVASVAGHDQRAVVASGLPLTTALRAVIDVETFRTAADVYLNGEKAFSGLVEAVRLVENWTREHGQAVTEDVPAEEELAGIRTSWLSGVGLRQLALVHDDAAGICRDLYGYQLPWILHAASQILSKIEDTDRPDALSEIALLVELGVPSLLASQIYLAGLRSRTVVSELCRLQGLWSETLAGIRRQLSSGEFVGRLRSLVSEHTAIWLDLLLNEVSTTEVLSAPLFGGLGGAGFTETGILHVRTLGGRTFVCSNGYSTKMEVHSSPELPFDAIADDPRFKFVHVGGTWKLVVRDPRVRST